MAYLCDQCGLSFTFKHNLKRHAQKSCKKHISQVKNHTIKAPNHTIEAPNHTIEAPNHTIEAPNHTIDAPNHTIPNDTGYLFEPTENNKHQCLKCLKAVTWKYARKHLGVCKGCPANTCRHCGKVFGKQPHVSRHERECGAEPSKDTDNPETPTVAKVTNNHYNNNNNSTTTIHNNHTNDHSSVQNSFNNNIHITLNVQGKESFTDLLELITTKYPNEFVHLLQNNDEATLMKLIHFNADFPENQTIRKPCKKDVGMWTHTGKGEWSKRESKDLLRTVRDNARRNVVEPFIQQNNKSSGFQEPNASLSTKYLEEVVYDETKRGTKVGTEDLLTPYVITAEEMVAEKVRRLTREMEREYPTIVHTPMFKRILGKEIVKLTAVAG